MSLLSYEEARPWAKSIKQRVAKREMPPWHADPKVGLPYAGDVSLSDDEIDTIVAWVDAGAPRGNPRDLPAPVAFPNDDEWGIDEPDLILTMTEEYEVPAEGPDQFVNFFLPTGLTEDRYIKAVAPVVGEAGYFVALLFRGGGPAFDSDANVGVFGAGVAPSGLHFFDLALEDELGDGAGGPVLFRQLDDLRKALLGDVDQVHTGHEALEIVLEQKVDPPAQLLKDRVPGHPLLPERPNAPLLHKCPVDVL